MPYLIYNPATPHERVYELKPGLNTLGREFDNTIVLIGETLSRRHAQIEITPAAAVITDCHSSNHTFVNQVQIDSCLLQEGDVIGFDRLQFKFVHSLTPTQFKIVENNQALSDDNLKQIPLPPSSVQLRDLVTPKPLNQSTINNLQHPLVNVDSQQENRHQQTVNKLRILLEVSKQLCSPEEPDQLLYKILDLLFQIISIDHAVILLVNPESQELEVKATKSQEDFGDQQFYSRKIVNLAYRSGNAVITENAKDDQRFKDSVSIIREEIENCMCIPLRNFSATIGVLYVHNSSLLIKYTHEDLEFMSALANQAAAIIHMSNEFYQREQKLKQQVMELQIQIDQSKKENDVAEILNMDSFQKLQERAEALRRKNNSDFNQ